MNVLLKEIHLPPSQITCFENLFGAIILWVVPMYTNRSGGSWKISQTWTKPLYLLRAAMALLGSWLWAVSVQKIPLLQSLAMGFLTPFVTVMGAWLFLGESITGWRILAIILGTIGGVFISFGGAIFHWNVQAFDPWVFGPLGASILFSLTNVLSKSLLSHTSPLSLSRSMMLTIGIGLLSTFPAWEIPSAMHCIQLGMLAGLAASAHISAHMAMARSDIIALLPLGLIKFIITGFLGWFFFQEVPSFGIVCGIILSIAASFCLSWRLKD